MATDVKEESPNLITKIGTVLGGSLMALLFGWVIIHSYRTSDALGKAPRYTIGYVTKTGYSIGPSSHSDVDFTYTVNDSTYVSSGTGDVPAGCQRCLVKFAAHAPELRTLYNGICVPQDVSDAPPEGWMEPPFRVPNGALD